MEHWEHFSHEADVGIRGVGPSLGAAFAQAGIALTQVVTDVEKVRPVETVEVRCTGKDPEILFVDFINALIYEMATRDMLFCRYQVEYDGERLRAEVLGEKVDRERHQPAVEVKGATFTELKVFRNSAGVWQAQCVVDV